MIKVLVCDVMKPSSAAEMASYLVRSQHEHGQETVLSIGKQIPQRSWCKGYDHIKSDQLLSSAEGVIIGNNFWQLGVPTFRQETRDRLSFSTPEGMVDSQVTEIGSALRNLIGRSQPRLEGGV